MLLSASVSSFAVADAEVDVDGRDGRDVVVVLVVVVVVAEDEDFAKAVRRFRFLLTGADDALVVMAASCCCWKVKNVLVYPLFVGERLGRKKISQQRRNKMKST